MTPESSNMFKKFMKAQFGKDETDDDFNRFLCNSPIFDETEPNFSEIEPLKDSKCIDKFRVFEDEGVDRALKGSYHLYHRIDDVLVAISCWDILETSLSSMFMMYDPDFKFLNLGHISAVREIEYMKMIQRKFNPGFKYYYMGHYSPVIPKIAYKDHMHPQYLLCPTTNSYFKLDEDMKAKIKEGPLKKLGESEEFNSQLY